MFKNNRQLTFTTQKANAWSPWTACSVFDWKYPFHVNLIKTAKCQFKLKFGSQANLSIQNSMLMFTFSVFVQKYLFWANQVQKNKTGSKS